MTRRFLPVAPLSRAPLLDEREPDPEPEPEEPEPPPEHMEFVSPPSMEREILLLTGGVLVIASGSGLGLAEYLCAFEASVAVGVLMIGAAVISFWVRDVRRQTWLKSWHAYLAAKRHRRG